MSQTIIYISFIIIGFIVFYCYFYRGARAHDKKILAVATVVVFLGYGIYYSSKFATPSKKPFVPPKVEQKDFASQLTPEEIEAKRQADEKHAAELEAKRQQEVERQRQLAEEKAAREAERAARRMSVDEFNARLLNIIDIDQSELGEVKHYVSGDIETFIYSLDNTETFDFNGALDLTEITKAGGIKAVIVKVKKINKYTLAAAIVLYETVVQALTSDIEANNIFGELSINETFLDNANNSQKTTYNGYIFERGSLGQTFTLSVTEQ